MLAATTLAVLFMLGLLPAMQGAFSLALQDSIEQRLASDVTTLISAARIENGRSPTAHREAETAKAHRG